MSKKIIGVSGNIGSFSEEAAKYYLEKNKISDHELKYLISVENVLSELEDGKLDMGIFPIENSNGGIVNEAVYAMAKHNFNIEALFEIDIKHNLLVKPGVKASDVTKIISHNQALKQCRMYLKRKWISTELEEYSDTASAACDISRGILPSTAAAIASSICADLYGLEILEEGIQDLKFNFTTFIAATRQ